jgi:hypothetical protein
MKYSFSETETENSLAYVLFIFFNVPLCFLLKSNANNCKALEDFAVKYSKSKMLLLLYFTIFRRHKDMQYVKNDRLRSRLVLVSKLNSYI